MRLMFSVLTVALFTASGGFAEEPTSSAEAPCVDVDGVYCDPYDAGVRNNESGETPNLDRALRGAIEIGRGAAEIGRAAVDAADARAPEAMDAGRDLVDRASGFFSTTRDRVRLLMNDEAP
jgi:hypothetical protein